MKESKKIIGFAIINIALFSVFALKKLIISNIIFSDCMLMFGFIITNFLYFKILNIKEKIAIKQKREALFSTITHDLKNPTLAQIKALDLLLNKTFGELNENQTEIISQIKSSCQYMKELIFQILDTYLYDSGKIILNRTFFDIIELLKSTLEENYILYKEKNQNIVIKNFLKETIIFSDKLQIKRAVTNLISNSINYGKINSNIEIILEENNNYINFKVKNISEYIPAEKLNVIFEKFQKNNYIFNDTGTGLGLYLTREIINAHKGEVFAQSYSDGVCIFGFKLPKVCKDKNFKSKIEYIEFK